ncbi:hypothetical protein GcM1_241040 [Golovinomyces cichoracearum]|uniref:Uncharacterized protein n=1 Tax=Golovinomyces cichoracearum TaxID=62708 RepID=A0A420IHH5_9PEZI|nr:hypothetical protein GcM1_241040 [Golovinomyces cichoracearum]
MNRKRYVGDYEEKSFFVNFKFSWVIAARRNGVANEMKSDLNIKNWRGASWEKEKRMNLCLNSASFLVYASIVLSLSRQISSSFFTIQISTREQKAA